ncbi:hypothetical protein OZX69_01455 [Lactobacillus sp. ESL0731]|nr:MULTISPECIES: hypothetical protein [unclassified Lactobacillus]WEV51416.1 hypothetical protein OZX63_01455 [Lactobacillus sp. ESL0700]WEV62546.1 hypothetical protein OZX69_01455 [Lactobacillus sp. ESL0731]
MSINHESIIYVDDTPEYEEFRQSALGHPSPERQKKMAAIGK